MIWEVLADFVAIANTAVQGNPDDTTASMISAMTLLHHYVFGLDAFAS
jgi:hypothetical protein